MKTFKISAAAVCGFAAAVLSTIPGFRNLGFCLIIPLAASASVVLSKKINKDISPVSAGTGFLYGIITGLFAALFSSSIDVVLTLIAHSNDFTDNFKQSEEMMRSLGSSPVVEEAIGYMRATVQQIRTTGFSLFYTFTFLLSNLVVDSLMGIAGGFAGMAFFNRRQEK